MTPPKEVPDAKIKPFPRNSRGDDSPGAHLATWGPTHAARPLSAGEIVMVERGKLVCRFTLHVRLEGTGFYIRGCRLVRWGEGVRVFLPQRSCTVHWCEFVEDCEEGEGEDGPQYRTIKRKTYYDDIFFLDRNRTERDFEEAVLSAVRHALARFHRRDRVGDEVPL